MDLKPEPSEFYVYKVRDSKAVILKQIDKNPGIRYRELLRLTGLTNGGLEYHLKILERSHKVKVDRHDGRRTRYYPLNISADESHTTHTYHFHVLHYQNAHDSRLVSRNMLLIDLIIISYTVSQLSLPRSCSHTGSV